MIEPIDPSNAPVILCHPACSGGSLIYKILVSHFGFVGVHEVGHLWTRSAPSFQPFDPELQLFQQGFLSRVQLDGIFTNRLLSCAAFAAAQTKRLLIREHTHQFFFDGDSTEVAPTEHSWVAAQVQKALGVPLKTLVTIRDPIDCWLGLQQSFSTLINYDFDGFCRRFNDWFDRIDRARAQGADIAIIKYEDIIEARDKSVGKIGSFLKAAPSEVAIPLECILSSGNSGRSSSKIARRTRRPYSRRLASAARESTAYVRLIERLDYPALATPPISDAVSYTLQNALNGATVYAARTIKTALRRAAVVGFKD